jgi:glycosyltransferase involved in cell wall biosynthesis
MSVDVIVPVCGDGAAMRRGLASVLAARQATPFEVIVVSDTPPEIDVLRWLRELAAQRRITLLELPERQGLAAALNRASELHRDLDRDLVILRADTEVAGDWLDRLVGHARVDDLGTVVPVASAASVAGYPRSGVDNPMLPGHSVATLDRLFHRANAGAAAVVPWSFGPCVYVSRACLNSVGAFQSPLEGSDAGVVEEFALRAASAGFRHLLAADVYVWCEGDAADVQQAAARARSELDRMHPQYRVARTELSHRDPARPYLRRVDLLRLAESPRQLLLFVAHAWGGGVRHHMDALAALVAEHCDVLLLEPAGEDTVKLSWLRTGEALVAYFSLPGEMPALVALLGELGLARVHFHHVHGLPRAILDLPGAARVPYDCTLHDYYPICPQYHLVDEAGRYCGEPDAAGCAACIGRRPGQWGLDITAWRDALHDLLRGADRVLAPSHDVARRIARYFPDLAIVVLPHADAHLPAPRVVRVLTLGRLAPAKGLHVVVACATEARAHALPLSFRVLGPTTERVPQWPDVALSVHGQYADSDLPALIAAERPDVIWFPSQVPESYSYTLSAALLSGAAIVAADIGALPERLAGHPRATLVSATATAGQWNDALLAAGGAAAALRVPQVRVNAS